MARPKNDGKGRLGGRQKGTPNKVASSVKEWLSTLIDKNRRQIEHDLKALDPRERLQMLEKLMQYVIPKQQAVSNSIEIEQLTDEQLDEVIVELTNNINNDTTE